MIRGVLLPAFMRLAGPANWWAPRPLRRLHNLARSGYAYPMNDREDLGHEPEETHDKEFAPVNRGADARGRQRGTGPRDLSGTGTPGVDTPHPDTLPPTEEGVQEAERHDDSS
ncbi:hypothetical protein F8566_36985 [Actinomadura rudentiformis]|uniref:Uncharacterized protein n=2 Tax=Actinomadura rudentiformis TaxID=359158 RepID=A0A6H9YIZ1_9ACTN|nr:hypothetical protein F8566_36985 [Actinomadura rudentiformis]